MSSRGNCRRPLPVMFDSRRGPSDSPRMRQTVALLAWVVGFTCCSTACVSTVAHEEISRSDTAPTLRCAPKRDGLQGLTKEWAQFAGFIDACMLSSADGSPALSVITVSAERYYADRPAGAETASLPKALILAPDGNEIGKLPYSYPDDPPFAIELSFSDWRGSRPQQIDILVRDPTVSGDHQLAPMRWNTTTRRYEGGVER